MAGEERAAKDKRYFCEGGFQSYTCLPVDIHSRADSTQLNGNASSKVLKFLNKIL